MQNRIALIVSCSLSLTLPQLLLAQDSPQEWFESGRQAVERNIALRNSQNGVARNVILFVGDGMGISTVTAARIFEAQLRGESGEENLLSFESFPSVALSKTYNTNVQVGDSAGTMSAMATGVKTKYGVISVNQNVVRGDCSTQAGNTPLTFLERAEMRGLSTGVISTARLTHATPAANYAHSMERGFEDDADVNLLKNPGACVDIARQLIEFSENVEGSNGLEVAMGGGRRNFLPETARDPEIGEAGFRLDGRNLPDLWQGLNPNNRYVWNNQQFDAIDPETTSQLLGLFEPSHMQYELDRNPGPMGEPSLSAMTEKAIDILSKNDDGYYLLVEGGRIDHAHHDTNPKRALMDAVEFSNAVRAAVEKVDLSETLIIVTADHSHVFTIAGSPKRGNPILGKVIGVDMTGEPTENFSRDTSELPYTTLSYANGRAPSINGTPLENTESGRPDLTDIDTTHESFHPEVTVPLNGETHGGEDVAIYAIGPGSDLVRGVMEQNVIFHVMMEASQMEQR